MKKLMMMITAVSALGMMTVYGMSNPPEAGQAQAGHGHKHGQMKGGCCTPDGSCKADGSSCGMKKGSCEKPAMKADCCTPDGSCKADGSDCGMKKKRCGSSCEESAQKAGKQCGATCSEEKSEKKAAACEGGTCELPK